MASPVEVREAGGVEGQLEIRRVGIDGVPQGELVTPDRASVWPMVATIEEVWLEPDDRTLVVVGLRSPSTVLHSLDVEESPDEVGLLAHDAFPFEVARQMAERSEQPGLILLGLPWRTEVSLRAPLGGRPVVDRGPSERRSRELEGGEPASHRALAALRVELSAAKTPAERRRIRQRMKAIRLNPLKALPLAELEAAEPESCSDRTVKET